MIIRLVLLYVLTIMGFALRVIDATTLKELHPPMCETSGASPNTRDCEGLLAVIEKMANVDALCMNDNAYGSACTTLATYGNCDVALCIGWGDPGCDIIATVVQALITHCRNDGMGKIGGSADITGFPLYLGNIQRVEIINHNGNGDAVVRNQTLPFRNETSGILNRNDEYQCPNTAYTLRVIAERNNNEPLLGYERNQLQTDFYHNYQGGGVTNRELHGSVAPIAFQSATADVRLYLDPTADFYVSDFSPHDLQTIIESVNDFRGQQNNPGWFGLQLLSLGFGPIGYIHFQLQDFAPW